MNSLEIFWFFLQREKFKVITVIILSVLAGLLETSGVALVYPILSAAFTESIASGNIFMSFFREIAQLLPISNEFIAYCIMFIIFALAAFFFRILLIHYRLRLSTGMVVKYHNTLFQKFLEADFQYFVNHKQGDIVYNTITAPNSLQTLVNMSVEIFSQGVLSVFVIALLISLSWKGTIIVLFMGIIYYGFTRILGQRVVYDAGKRQAEAHSESLVILNEVFSGIKQVKVFNIVGQWLGKFADAIRRYWNNYMRRMVWQLSLTPLLTLILYVFIGIIAIVIGLLYPDSFASLIPVFGTFAFAVFRLVPIIGSVTGCFMEIKAAMPNCERVLNVIHEETATMNDGDKGLDSLKSKVEFDNVTFAYPGRGNILGNVSLTFDKGETTAIVGRSGSGKTTLVNLMLRLFDVSSGEIRIDGIDIRQYRAASWLAKIGFVSQETFIFNDTIRNNITLGSEYAEEEIIRMCRYADAHSFISEMPDGYDTVVGDRGMRLSGGQTQRIAVARAMIRNPEILIFDEATNALDNISEAAVQRAIDTIAEDHTVIVIAHRLSTIVNADKIIVLGDGSVLEQGKHKELMAKGGAYCELYRSQVNS